MQMRRGPSSNPVGQHRGHTTQTQTALPSIHTTTAIVSTDDLIHIQMNLLKEIQRHCQTNRTLFSKSFLQFFFF